MHSDHGFGTPYHSVMRALAPCAGGAAGYDKRSVEMAPPPSRLMTSSSHIHIDTAVSPVHSTHGRDGTPPSVPRYSPCTNAYYGRLSAAYPYQYSSPSSSSQSASPPSACAGLPSLGFAVPHHVSQPQCHLRPPPPLQQQQQQQPLPQQQRKRAAPVAGGEDGSPAGARKRSRHAWPAEATRDIINVLLNEFLNDPAFRTTIYRSREERDHRFAATGRPVLEEYNKVQNMRRRYFIPLSYLLQWDQLQVSGSARSRQRAVIEKKLSKPLECSRLQQIFSAALKRDCVAPVDDQAPDDQEPETDCNGKQMFEIHIFVAELTRRDPRLWARSVAAFDAWMSRYHRGSIDFILNHH